MKTIATQPAAPAAAPAVMPARSPSIRLSDFYEVYQSADAAQAQREGGRCMNCGAAFCMPDSGYGPPIDSPGAIGCPIQNKIPEWNELVRLGRWRDAYDRLSLTNPFPEFTSRVCPAPCQDACIVGINERPIEIKGIERAIIDRAFESGWVVPAKPESRTGKRVAIIGSGPAGLAAAHRLIGAGHDVTVFERSDEPGGLLMYGIPNMKLDKDVVRRRVRLLAQSGVRFRVSCDLGGNVDPQGVVDEHDAVLLAVGALRPRGLELPGRELEGVHEAMDYLTDATRRMWGKPLAKPPIDAGGKDVIVIGGGDTGADCLGTALRQGCRSLLNLTRRERPPKDRPASHPWPGPTGSYTLDYAHGEGLSHFGRDPREYQVDPVAILPDAAGARVAGVRVRRLDTGRLEDLPAQMVVTAIGFVGHDAPPLVEALGIGETLGRLQGEDYRTAAAKIYTAGDCRRGPSLVVWAIREGLEAAGRIDHDLRGHALS